MDAAAPAAYALGALLLAGAALFTSGLFGFVEHGYRTPIALAVVAEVTATCLLVVLAGRRHPQDDEPLSEHELEMTIRNRLYGESGASLDVIPSTAESQRGGSR